MTAELAYAALHNAITLGRPSASAAMESLVETLELVRCSPAKVRGHGTGDEFDSRAVTAMRPQMKLDLSCLCDMWERRARKLIFRGPSLGWQDNR